MKICLISPIYATSTSGDSATPVVHYFAKEWAKMGHTVVVYNLEPKYPRPYYWIGKKFQHQLNTHLGMLVPTEYPSDGDICEDGVCIYKRTISKFIPHSRYSKSELDRIINLMRKDFASSGVPDCFIGHWDNPQLEILNALKRIYSKKTALVLHNNSFSLEQTYGDETLQLLQNIDVIGFRNYASKCDFERKYFKPDKSFIAFSGVPKSFLSVGQDCKREFIRPIKNIVFVGSLIQRKHPLEILKAAINSLDEDFNLTYIGDGLERETIIKEHTKQNKKGNIIFTGRISRENIISYLKNADMFIMISEQEVFGLVYLEAMALGLITVGSRNEGIDGIIKDGVNGFLCEAGNSEELSELLKKLKKMPCEKMQEIANNAKQTALAFSDKKVAESYINSVMS